MMSIGLGFQYVNIVMLSYVFVVSMNNAREVRLRRNIGNTAR